MRAIVIEDNEDLAECMVQSLDEMGICADHFKEVRLFNHSIEIVDYDIAVLDLNLPDGDGLQLVSLLREKRSTIPVLIVSARASVEDRVTGLDIGADDYLVKPFELSEFEARIRALMRRPIPSTDRHLSVGNLVFNESSREFELCGEILDLPPRERAVLEILIRLINCPSSKEYIADHIFNFDDEASISSIEIYVHRLRKKLAHADIEIKTKRGLGYLLTPNEH